MKLAIFLLPVLAGAQSLTISAPARALPGQTITAALILTSGAADVAALQWSVPSNVTLPAAQPVVANKARMCAPSSPICVLVGIVPSPVNGVIAPGATFNALPIPSGPIQNFSVAIPVTAQPGDVITVQVSGVVGASAAGSLVAVSAAPVTITVSDPADVNGDGAVNQADQQSVLYMWRAAPTLANFLLLALIAGRLQP